jgi:DNA-directed RNA polymerase subunit K/omega
MSSKFEVDEVVERSDDEEDETKPTTREDDDDDDDVDVEDDVVDDEDNEDEDEGDEDEEPELADEDNADDNNNLLSQQRLGLLDGTDLDAADDAVDFKKFDSPVRQSMLEQNHPELLMENNQDVQRRTHIERDVHGRIVDPHHCTLPLLTKYEKARILGERAKQLNAGARPMVDVPAHIIDGYLIALQEFEAKKIPFIVKRPLLNGTCEYWKFSDLETL